MLVIIRINVNSITTVYDSIVKRTLWLLYPCQKCVFKLFCACSAQCAWDTYQASRNTPWTECKPMHVGSRSSLRQVNSDCSDNGWVHKNSSRQLLADWSGARQWSAVADSDVKSPNSELWMSVSYHSFGKLSLYMTSWLDCRRLEQSASWSFRVGDLA